MPYTTLITPAELANHLDDPDWAIFDCRYALTDHVVGRHKYLENHIPGAVYADLGQDLSGEKIPGKTGRHPLPAVETFAETLSRWGIDERVQVVAYDDAGGVYAGRLWWMLRWMGHDTVAVLDGDWRAWEKERQGFDVSSAERDKKARRAGEETRPRREFGARVRPDMLASLAEVEAEARDPQGRLLDARAADRFRGENEMIDAKAGHIPSAVCAFYAANLTTEGRFQSSAFLRDRFTPLLGNVPANQAIFYCGSGVSACHNLLAMEIAGLPGGRLYVGSWSEWSARADRPVAVGEG